MEGGDKLLFEAFPDSGDDSIAIETTPLRRRFFIFLALCAVDIAVNTAAAVAATATGAHVNGSLITAEVLRMGATAGLLKASIIAFIGLVKFGQVSNIAAILLTWLGSGFGIAIIVTIAISGSVLGTVPTPLGIAAVVAGILLTVDFVITQQDKGLPWQFLLIGIDTLAGYVFVRMAQNQDYKLATVQAGAAAGAVFGAILFLKKVAIFFAQGRQTVSIVISPPSQQKNPVQEIFGAVAMGRLVSRNRWGQTMLLDHKHIHRIRLSTRFKAAASLPVTVAGSMN